MASRYLLLALILGFSILASAQSLRNGGFEQTCDTCKTGLAFWELSWNGRKVSCSADQGALRIACMDSVDAVGFVEQAISMAPVKEPVILTVSAQVRTSDLLGKGASLNVACYDEQNGFLTNKDMGLFRFNWAHGTSVAEPQTLKLILPEGTAVVKVGAIVNGRGQAWFDAFTMSASSMQDRFPDKPALAYIGAACDTIHQHALYGDSVDLDAARNTALKIAGGNNDPSDRHLAVEYLLQSLGDHHSFLMKPSEYKAWENDDGGNEMTYATHKIINGYGYVSVPGFASGDSLDMRAFADSLQRALQYLSMSDIKGWIVDLRQNTGGNMAPMVCGLGPLFDPGVLGTLTDVRGKVEHWYYRDGAYGWDDEIVMRLDKPVTLGKKLPIAVLTAQQTGSSGECTTISFIGNSNTRSFGQPTWGLTTGNGQFELPDGAQMFMASTMMGDRHGNLFHGAIVPDEPVEQPADWSYDASVDAALKWLGAQR